jgi:hypothetical protein
MSNRRRQLEAKPVKPVLIKVANEPLQLIQDLMRLNIAAKSKGRPRKKPLERQQAVNDLTVALLNGAEETSTHTNQTSVASENKRNKGTRKEAVLSEEAKITSRLRPGVNKSAKPVSSLGYESRELRKMSSALDHLEEEEEEAGSEDELRLQLSLSEDELTIS